MRHTTGVRKCWVNLCCLFRYVWRHAGEFLLHHRNMIINARTPVEHVCKILAANWNRCWQYQCKSKSLDTQYLKYHFDRSCISITASYASSSTVPCFGSAVSAHPSYQKSMKYIWVFSYVNIPIDAFFHPDRIPYSLILYCSTFQFISSLASTLVRRKSIKFQNFDLKFRNVGIFVALG